MDDGEGCGQSEGGGRMDDGEGCGESEGGGRMDDGDHRECDGGRDVQKRFVQE